MAEQDLLSSFGIGSIDMSAIVDKVYVFLGILFLAAVIGGLVALMAVMWKKKKGQSEKVKIGWWEEVNGKLQPTFMEDVEEIVIPGTTLRVFYGKKRDIWLPRFNLGITTKLYYVAITKSRQMVNFVLPALTGNLTMKGLEHDHTDMQWAAENTREFIKRNYKDKSVKWWQLYKDAISTAIHIMINTFSLILIIFFLKGLVNEIAGVVSTLNTAVQASCSSGIAASMLMIKIKKGGRKNGG